jgi:hypothetical protein
VVTSPFCGEDIPTIPEIECGRLLSALLATHVKLAAGILGFTLSPEVVARSRIQQKRDLVSK